MMTRKLERQHHTSETTQTRAKLRAEIVSGDPVSGGDSTAVREKLIDIQGIQSALGLFVTASGGALNPKCPQTLNSKP